MSFDRGIINTANLPQQEHRALVGELRLFLPDAEDGGQALMLSQAPPGWVEVVASVATWHTVFKVGAATFLGAYLKKVGEKAGEATSVTKIREFVALWHRRAKRLTNPPVVNLKIPGPGVHFTRLVLCADDPERSAHDFSLFVLYLPSIQRAIDSLNADDIGGEVTVRVRVDSFLIEWLSYSEFQAYCQSFDSEGTPLTDPERKQARSVQRSSDSE